MTNSCELRPLFLPVAQLIDQIYQLTYIGQSDHN